MVLWQLLFLLLYQHSKTEQHHLLQTLENLRNIIMKEEPEFISLFHGQKYESQNMRPKTTSDVHF